MSIRDKLLRLLGSLKVKNKDLLDSDIALYSSTPESIAVGFICAFNSSDEIVEAFSSRYDFVFPDREKRQLISLIDTAKSKTSANYVPYGIPSWAGYGY